MTVHSFHIFDRRGKTLFTKRYVPKQKNNNNNNNDATEDANKNDDEVEEERLSEQRKLVFGMLYSLRELSSSLSPVDGPGDLQFMKTGASNVYNYETVSGLRFVLYTTHNNDITSSRPTINNNTNNINPTNTGSNSSATTSTTPQSSSHGNPTNNNPNLVGGPTSTGLINSATAVTNPSSGMNNMNDPNSSSMHGNTMTTGTTNPTQTANIRSSLKYIYEHIWVAYVIRSPMYQPNCNNKDNDNAIKSTNFEVTLDNYLKGMTWYR
jgi:hypothetical protein